ncbi:hypothetical protein DPMN_041681 [Dreissena polymorpha]|uniref:Uncharacterized protein n=1 Tax=Dreissena polymorpha TaxID=45954 RepID=A0A9D4HWB0_DREPO|nr:hypothetical protein DPMN_041681 [Dreissena polymorpha]
MVQHCLLQSQVLPVPKVLPCLYRVVLHLNLVRSFTQRNTSLHCRNGGIRILPFDPILCCRCMCFNGIHKEIFRYVIIIVHLVAGIWTYCIVRKTLSDTEYRLHHIAINLLEVIWLVFTAAALTRQRICIIVLPTTAITDVVVVVR